MTAHETHMPDAAPEPEFVSQLLRAQAPDVAHLPVRRASTSGSSNWVFRLGDDLAVRLPRTDDYGEDLLNEVRWLPHIAAGVPVPIPRIIAVGESTDHFPRSWSVVSWLTGELPLALDAGQQMRFAETLGTFLRSLHGLDTDGAPSGPAHWGYRCGEPVTDTIDGWAEHAATELANLFDKAAVLEAWLAGKR